MTASNRTTAVAVGNAIVMQGYLMDLHKLRCFRAVAQMEHISNAASKLHMTQPALSKTIALLEEEVGGRLFDRVGRKIALNEHGRLFLQHTEQALNALDNGIALMKELNTPQYRQRIKLQTNLLAKAYLRDLVCGFRQENPDAAFEIITSYSKSRYQETCDCYIASSRIHFYQCQSVPIFTEEIVLAVSKQHPLAAKDTIDLAEVAQVDFIGTRKNFSWTVETEEFCMDAGFQPRYRVICDSISLMAELVAANEGVTFLCKYGHDYDVSNLKMLHIAHPQCLRHYNLSWPTNKPQSDMTKKFIQYVQDFFKNKSDPTEK